MVVVVVALSGEMGAIALAEPFRIVLLVESGIAVGVGVR